MPNVANLIDKSNIKKLKNKQHIEPLNANAFIRPLFPLKGRYQYECIVYKVEVYGFRPNNSNNDRSNDIKVYVG